MEASRTKARRSLLLAASALVAAAMPSALVRSSFAWGPHMHAAIALDSDVLRAAREAYARLKGRAPGSLSVTHYLAGAVGPDISSDFFALFDDTWHKHGAWYHQTPPMRVIEPLGVKYEWSIWYQNWKRWQGSALLATAVDLASRASSGWQSRDTREMLSFALGWIVHNVSDQALDFSGGANQEADTGNVPIEGGNLNRGLWLRLWFDRIAIERHLTPARVNCLPDCAWRVGQRPLSELLVWSFTKELANQWMVDEDGHQPQDWTELHLSPEEGGLDLVREQADNWSFTIAVIREFTPVVAGVDTHTNLYEFLLDRLPLLGWENLNPQFSEETVDQALRYYAWGDRVDQESGSLPFRPRELGARQRAVAALGSFAKPKIYYFKINYDAPETTSYTVRLTNVCSTATYVAEYKASEKRSDLDNAVGWSAYSGAPDFTLSAGEGTKTVYFRVRNQFGMSATLSDSIAVAWKPEIVYQSSDGNLYVCDRLGNDHPQLVGTGDCSEPVWSPDGSKVLYRRGTQQVWVVNADGSAPKQVGGWDKGLGGLAWLGNQEFVTYWDTWTNDMFEMLKGSLSGEQLKAVWRPGVSGGPKWGWMYDYSPSLKKFALTACRSNWTVDSDLYFLEPKPAPEAWQATLIWSDANRDHEDGHPRWAALTDRVAWTHAVQAGLSPANHQIGIRSPGGEVRWVGSQSGNLWLQDWTADDELLVLDTAGGQRLLRVLDDTGNLVREIPCPRQVINARWRKWTVP